MPSRLRPSTNTFSIQTQPTLVRPCIRLGSSSLSTHGRGYLIKHPLERTRCTRPYDTLDSTFSPQRHPFIATQKLPNCFHPLVRVTPHHSGQHSGATCRPSREPPQRKGCKTVASPMWVHFTLQGMQWPCDTNEAAWWTFSKIFSAHQNFNHRSTRHWTLLS